MANPAGAVYSVSAATLDYVKLRYAHVTVVHLTTSDHDPPTASACKNCGVVDDGVKPYIAVLEVD
jgi:hypothetical protein